MFFKSCFFNKDHSENHITLSETTHAQKFLLLLRNVVLTYEDLVKAIYGMFLICKLRTIKISTCLQY